jgi:hypothetical protein
LLDFPFPGESILLFAVAVFTRSNQVAFGRLPTPDERNKMIHGQFRRWKLLLTVVTHPARAFTLPPG